MIEKNTSCKNRTNVDSVYNKCFVHDKNIINCKTRSQNIKYDNTLNLPNCTPNDLKITFINVNGLLQKSKYPEFIEFINKYDIIGITESNMTKIENLELKNFSILKTKERPFYIRASGGITVLVKNDIKEFVNYIDTESEFVLWIEIDKKLTGYKSNIILGTVYIPGETSTYFCKDAYDVINNERINYFYDKDNIILGGDFNSRTNTLNDFIIQDEEDLDINDVDEIITATNIFFQYHKCLCIALT